MDPTLNKAKRGASKKLNKKCNFKRVQLKNMQIDENISFDQFSHDLTLALEETSKVTGASRWGVRRRTRSTGNLRTLRFILLANFFCK